MPFAQKWKSGRKVLSPPNPVKGISPHWEETTEWRKQDLAQSSKLPRIGRFLGRIGKEGRRNRVLRCHGPRHAMLGVTAESGPKRPVGPSCQEENRRKEQAGCAEHRCATWSAETS
jgi:hypothetical protein